MKKQIKEDLIIEIDHKISACAGLIEANNLRIVEMIEANQRHAYDIQKANRQRAQLVEELKP